MKILTTQYYHHFRCIASACPDSCCKEWEVDVDPETAIRYRTLSGPLGDRLRQVLTDTDNGTVMVIEDGRCPMWRQDGLCRIQAELGHDALCSVCRQFPRLHHDYGSFVEQDLELSCPEAARLILCEEDSFIVADAPGGEADYDASAMGTLLRSRDEVLTFLRNTDYPLPQSLIVLLLYGHAVQGELDGGEQVCLQPEEILADIPQFADSGDMDALFKFFLELEILTPQWAAQLQGGPGQHPWDPKLQAFARYMVRRYWLQAVSDYDLISRVKFTVTACLLLNALGGDMVATAQRFSKEIENDPDNVEAILDGSYRIPALTDSNLLSLLQNSQKSRKTP